MLKGLLSDPSAILQLREYHIRVANCGNVEEECDWAGKTIADARYDLGCLQDLFLGAMLYHWTTTGAADSQAPLSAYLPELSRSVVGEEVRLAHIGSHSMGVYAPSRPLPKWADAVQFLRAAELSFPPGTVVNYGPLESQILARLVARIGGASLIEVMTRNLVEPAGATRIEWRAAGFRVGMMASLKDLERLARFVFSGAFADGRFVLALDRDRVALVRRKEAESSVHPTGYSWGAASFSGSFWGHNGTTKEYSLGFRAMPDFSLSLAVAARGHDLRREWIVDYLLRAYGRPMSQCPGVLGAVRGLEYGLLPGMYEAQPGERCEIELDAEGALQCRFFRSEQMLGALRGHLEPSGVIVGNLRWPGLRMEFFPHPATGVPCMTRGVNAYRKL